MSVARKKFDLKGKKIANHSVRKTGIGMLLDANVPEIFVAQHSGMASTDSLKSYKTASAQQQHVMSSVLNGQGSSTAIASRNQASQLIPDFQLIPDMVMDNEMDAIISSYPAIQSDMVPAIVMDNETDDIISSIPASQLRAEISAPEMMRGLFYSANLNGATININICR